MAYRFLKLCMALSVFGTKDAWRISAFEIKDAWRIGF